MYNFQNLITCKTMRKESMIMSVHFAWCIMLFANNFRTFAIPTNFPTGVINCYKCYRNIIIYLQWNTSLNRITTVLIFKYFTQSILWLTFLENYYVVVLVIYNLFCKCTNYWRYMMLFTCYFLLNRYDFWK